MAHLNSCILTKAKILNPANLVKEVCQLLGVSKTRTTPSSIPNQMGCMIERFHHTLFLLLSMAASDNEIDRRKVVNGHVGLSACMKVQSPPLAGWCMGEKYSYPSMSCLVHLGIHLPLYINMLVNWPLTCYSDVRKHLATGSPMSTEGYLWLSRRYLRAIICQWWSSLVTLSRYIEGQSKKLHQIR